MIPTGSRVLLLGRGTKVPLPGSHGHLQAVPLDQVDLSLVPSRYNYGIALDGQYLCLDVDDPEKFYEANPDFDPGDAWTQTTRRGFHVLYEWHGGGRNYNIPGANVKVNGFIVGPGSVIGGKTYEYQSGMVGQAPTFLRPLPTTRDGVDVSTEEPSGRVPTSGIPTGGHDEFLHRFASWLRGRYGLDEEAIARALQVGPLGVLLDGDPSNPYGETSLRRIARSAARYEPGDLPVLVRSGRVGSEVGPRPDAPRDILPGFIPEAALTILYGDGKIGKSSFLSWLAARVTSRGVPVVFVPSGEETFDLFVMRARLNGANDTLLHEYTVSGALLPGGLPGLIEYVNEVEAGLVLIDALYSHFGPGQQGENEATRARSRLTPLAEAAREHDFAVLGTIHENAGGGHLGSREMRNVCRSLIHAKGGRGKDFTIWSAGSNGWSPDYGVTFPGVAVPILDESGQPMTFVDLFGDVIAHSIWTLSLGERVDSASVLSADVGTKYEKVKDYVREKPNATNADIMKALDLPSDTVKHYASGARKDLGVQAPKGRPPNNGV